MAPQLTIDESQVDARIVLTVAGEIDLATAPQLQMRVAEVNAAEHLILDMSGVTFMDSTGLRVVIGAHERAREAGGRFALVAPDGPVTKLLAITGVDAWLDVFATQASATADD